MPIVMIMTEEECLGKERKREREREREREGGGREREKRGRGCRFENKQRT